VVADAGAAQTRRSETAAPAAIACLIAFNFSP